MPSGAVDLSMSHTGMPGSLGELKHFGKCTTTYILRQVENKYKIYNAAINPPRAWDCMWFVIQSKTTLNKHTALLILSHKTELWCCSSQRTVLIVCMGWHTWHIGFCHLCMMNGICNEITLALTKITKKSLHNLDYSSCLWLWNKFLMST